jgi:transcription antitermination protein NusB
MLSRRNIRIKIMQLLYAKSRDAELNINNLILSYQEYGKRTIDMYLYNFAYFMEVAHYAVKDEVNRRSKLMPSDEDKKFTAKLYRNEVLQQFILRGVYDQAVKKHNILAHIDEDTVSNFYRKFFELDVYKNYLQKSDNTEEEHRTILIELYRYLYTSETFFELMEDFSPSWIDDDTLIIGATKKTLKALPSDNEFFYKFSDEDHLTVAFGEQLLLKSYNQDENLLEEIKPMLKNWDAERVATIDMILIKMALAELMYFPTIPTKVTINEYVDISKAYSTDKSKDFVNGILDRMMKKLKDEGKIVKEGRGLIE